MVTKVDEIVEKARELKPIEFTLLLDRLWDIQIEQDSLAGRLDHLIAEAEAEHKAGTTKPL